LNRILKVTYDVDFRGGERYLECNIVTTSQGERQMEHFTVAEVAEITNVSEQTIRAMLREGVLPGEGGGGKWTIPGEAVEVLLDLVGEEYDDEDEDDED
jgi:excisionase family DNA binding protein